MKAIRRIDVARSCLALVLAAGWGVLLAAPAAAAGGCLYTIDGQDLDAATTQERAITLSNDQTIVLTAVGPGPLGQLHIAAKFWPTAVEVPQPAVTADSTWTGTVDLSDQPLAVQGLYQIEISKDPADCPPTTAWVQITGGSPFTTVPGVIGTGMAIAGSIALIVALRAAVAGRGGAVLGAIGGALMGLGALVVAQQAGATPIDARSATVWTLLPGAIGATVTRTVGGIFGRGAPDAVAESAPSASAGAEPPPTGAVTESPPTEAASEPPPTTAGEPPPTDAAAGALPPPTGTADPPRVSYAHLAAPDAVVAVVPFELDVGLGAAPDADVGGAPIVRPAWSVGAYTLTIQLLADGFEPLEPGPDPWRIDLDVTADAPYPTRIVKLRATEADRPIRGRQIRATYSIEGQVMGVATRQIAVVDDAVRLQALQPIEPRPPATLSTPRGEEAPDLTVTIEHQEDESGGSFWLQLLTRDGMGIRPDFDRIADRPRKRRPGVPAGRHRIRSGQRRESVDATRAGGHRSPDRPAAPAAVLGGLRSGRGRRRTASAGHPDPVGRGAHPMGARHPAQRGRPRRPGLHPGSWERRPTSLAGSSASRLRAYHRRLGSASRPLP